MLKDKIKLKKGERGGEVLLLEWGIIRDWGYLRAKHRTKGKPVKLNNWEKNVTEIFI